MPALKGALFSPDAKLQNSKPNIVVFQFNPERVTRTPTLVQQSRPSDGAGSRDARQQPAAPGESISFSLRLDATDQLAAGGQPTAAQYGILPALSALELMMIPRGLRVNLAAMSGDPKKPYTNPPARLPTVLFFWGGFRLLPVTISSLQITETEYDMQLNPVRAEVTVTLQVLTPSQFPRDAAAVGDAYYQYQHALETMAALHADNLASEPGTKDTLAVDIVAKSLKQMG